MSFALASFALTSTSAANLNTQKTECFEMFSDMETSSLTKFYDNPDKNTKGYAEFKLCTNGTMTGMAYVYGGKTELIASHIHEIKNFTDRSGPPVINFCGDNTQGLINDSFVMYMETCNEYMGGGSMNRNMTGGWLAWDNQPKGVCRGDMKRNK
eukprot:Pgem_evm1s9410